MNLLSSTSSSKDFLQNWLKDVSIRITLKPGRNGQTLLGSVKEYTSGGVKS